MLRRAYTWRSRDVVGTSSVAIGKRQSQSGDEDATTADVTHDPKSLSPLELFFRPFWSTTQEKYLLKKLYSTNSCVVVISSFRGCRKSTTVERLAKRLKYRHFGLGLWPWIMQVEHIRNYANYEKKFVKKEPKLISIFFAAMQYLGNLIFVVGCCVPCYIFSVWWREESVSPHDLWDRVVSRAPGPEDLLNFVVILFVAGCFSFRRKVVVVDDLLNFKFPGEANDMAYNVLCELDRLKSRANAGNRIVIVSSNEGICRLFSDTNPSTYMAATFPKASDEEMMEALQRCKLGTTSAEFERAKELYKGIPHHLYSTCWWLIVAKHIRQIPRTVHFTVALELDLQCQAVARHYALAYSQEVDVATALTNLFTEAEVDDIVRIYGPRGPRRLVLTAGLLITGRGARLHGTVALTEQTVADLRGMLPNTSNKVALKEAEESLKFLKECVEQRHAVKVYEPGVAKAEAVFGNAVRRVLEAGVGAFQVDEKCEEEIDRIKRLLI